MPDDEAFDYLTTQAIADFLSTENEPRLDGIIFASAQSKGGRNVVLFHKSARIREMEFPDGTEIDAHSGFGTDDGWENDYAVSEVVPPAGSLPAEVEGEFEFLFLHSSSQMSMDSDFREDTLQVDPTSLEVHHVEWVKVNSTQFPVSRRRYEKTNWKS